MAKSFKDYLGDFNANRDKLMFHVGELAQIPQRATNMLPRLVSFINSADESLQRTGSALKTRAELVRDLSRSEYNKAQSLIGEMSALKDAIEKHPSYQQMIGMSTTGMLVALAGKLLNKSGDLEFFQNALTQAVNLGSRSATTVAALQKANTEIKALERLSQETADYAKGKGLLPAVEPSASVVSTHAVMVKWLLPVAAVAAVGGFFLLRRK